MRSHAGTRLCILLAALAGGLAGAAAAQNVGAVQQVKKEPEYPENLKMTQQQGNVLMIAVIDRHGKLREITPIATSHEGFVDSAVAAAKQWKFKPATRNGRPIEIAANIGMRFRLQLAEKRGQIPRPTLGNVDIAPADANGKATAPEGFPIRQGADPKLLADALIDVSINPMVRTIPLNVEAWSPGGRRFPVFETSLFVPANATELKVPVIVAIKPDWEDGVWMLRFFVDDADAGGGQFWLARDPWTFDFGSKMPKVQALPN